MSQGLGVEQQVVRVKLLILWQGEASAPVAPWTSWHFAIIDEAPFDAFAAAKGKEIADRRAEVDAGGVIAVGTG